MSLLDSESRLAHLTWPLCYTIALVEPFYRRCSCAAIDLCTPVPFQVQVHSSSDGLNGAILMKRECHMSSRVRASPSHRGSRSSESSESSSGESRRRDAHQLELEICKLPPLVSSLSLSFSSNCQSTLVTLSHISQDS